MKNNIKAIIFDLDGTIADTISAIAEGINLTMDKLSLPHHTDAQVRTYINFGPRHLITQALPENLRTPEMIDKAFEVYNEMYDKTYMHTDKTYDGMVEVISELSKHYKIAILSNKQDEYVKALAKQLLPSGVCLGAFGTLDGIPAKPEPIIAHRVADFLSVSPKECILVGDSQVDIKTAKNAGFACLCVSWGYASIDTLLENGATDIVNTPSELLKFFT